MALQLTVTVGGVEITNAYHQVYRPAQGNGSVLAFKVCTFKDGAKANAYETDPLTAEGPLQSETVRMTTFDKAGANAHTQAYDYLKTLPEWAGATDV